MGFRNSRFASRNVRLAPPHDDGALSVTLQVGATAIRATLSHEQCVRILSAATQSAARECVSVAAEQALVRMADAFCTRCGTRLVRNCRFCTYCGRRVPAA